MIFPTLEQVIKNRHLKSDNNFFRSQYPEFYDYLCKNYSSDLSFIEKIYWYYHNISIHPVCKTCGQPVKFHNFTKGYNKFCCAGCASKNKEIKNKKIQTTKLHYGVENPSQCQEILKKKESTCLKKYGVSHSSKTDHYKKIYKETNLKKYGVPNPMQCDSVKKKLEETNLKKYGELYFMGSKMFKEKSTETNLKKYGVPNPMQCDSVKKKLEETNLKKYGVPNPSMCDRISEKIKCSKRKNIYEEHNLVIDIKDDYDKYYHTYVCQCPDPTCNKCDDKIFEIKNTQFYYRLYNHLDLCNIRTPNLNYNSSIEVFIENILNNYNIKYIKHDRSILGGLELDIYIPSKKLAIECNGCYWHSDKIKPQKYHYNKFKKCQEKEIQLLSIWEDQIINKPKIIESLILSKLGIYENKVYARKCTIKPVTSNNSSQFLNDNHLQGSVSSSIRIGLYYEEELISIMTFGKKRKCLNSKEEWELYRYCCKKGYQIIGGASKLFKYFIKNYNPNNIISFSSNDISNGNLYKILGFVTYKKPTISYWYIDRKYNRHHRYNFRKDILVKEGYDKNKTEFQIMDELEYFRIYDSGQTKWEWTLN